MNLTNRVIKSLEPSDKPRVVWDSMSGFGIRIFPGGAKVFLVRYRHEGRQRYKTVGKFGVLTPDEARRRARVLLGEVASGDDPAAKSSSRTVGEVFDIFLAEHCDKKLRARTASDYRKFIDRLARPALGKHRMDAVSRQDLAKLHRKLGRTPRQANLLMAILSKFFGWAERHGHMPEGTPNPVSIDKYPERKRTRSLNKDEYGRLGAALRSPAVHPVARDAITLLALTGCRLNEVLGMSWDEIDFEKAVFKLPEHRGKTGGRTVRLNTPAVELLQAIRRVEGNPHVFVGRLQGSHFVGIEKQWQAIRKVAKVEGLPLHGLRHSFASVTGSLGYTRLIVSALLGHAAQGVTEDYSHLEGDMLARASEEVGLSIKERMDANIS